MTNPMYSIMSRTETKKKQKNTSSYGKLAMPRSDYAHCTSIKGAFHYAENRD